MSWLFFDFFIMFKASTGKEGAGGDTVIANGVKVEGDFQSQGNLIIEGEVLGNVKTAADLYVGERARIHANVSATNARVSGEIRGNVKIKEKLELTPTSRIFGDAHTKILIVEAGAMINGKIIMGSEEEAAAAKAAERVDKANEGLSLLLGGRSRSEKGEKIKL
ncbi:hypothetical protein A3F28_02850 [Candidatus Uhrbacteria bacterium RIFCSPHIGHO2_12_FULL_57_11]|uniref:Cell shape determination protein CcmA n=2 Tax=Candidatus Uhriibacteriota TaxID=1752732 RepID=A0A1F7UJJ9_9BACT|nr:MAG: hypothetical protein A3D72_00840 [Candidatus Uhrbacteria bacterium RIFCSPHIGHO2_02_FULL_57_19]OGL78439.1 MAG: hypothetical protein A3F28_02850 [Candidatus Uhrbacteria bacterium RIFCSPHIGHO2_12_FULL_57_11]